MKYALRTALILVLLFTGAAFGFGRLETALVYPFDKTRVAPADAAVPRAREVRFTTQGSRLIVWVAPPAKDKPTLLYFHGNAGNLANRAGRFNRFLDRGYGLIAPAYRGSSGSRGRPSEARITADMTAVYGDLGRLIPGLTPDQVVIYGESLGTAVALKLLAQDHSAQPAAVVLEAPFTSIADVVRHTDPRFAPYVDRLKNTWNSAEHVRALRAPLLVMHGTQDALIPMEQGQRIHRHAGSSDKTFLKVRGGTHTDLWRSDTLPRLWRFIDAQALSRQ